VLSTSMVENHRHLPVSSTFLQYSTPTTVVWRGAAPQREPKQRTSVATATATGATIVVKAARPGAKQ